MFDKWMQYSYAAQKHQRYRLIKIIFTFLILYIIYNIFTVFLFSVWVMDNDTMQPELACGDRIILSSFALPVSVGNNIDEKSLPIKRGSIVLLDMGREKERKTPLKILDGAVRFFTAQTVSIFSNDGQYYIKRVIALPGDEIYMSNFIFKVKPSGSLYYLTEFELAQTPYHPSIPQIPALWDESVPFSGNTEKIVLGQDECFVISDDRSNTNDSRTWGSVQLSDITAKAIIRFWPLNKIRFF
jgi:signal peptidase I